MKVSSILVISVESNIQRKVVSENTSSQNMKDSNIQGGPKKSVFSKNENRPWWGFFEKKSMTNKIKKFL